MSRIYAIFLITIFRDDPDLIIVVIQHEGQYLV